MTLQKLSCGWLLSCAWLPDSGKLRQCWAVCKRSVLAVALLAPISACTANSALDPYIRSEAEANASLRASESPETASSNDTSPFYWPWSDEPAQKPPALEPYKIPTLVGDHLNFRAKIPPIVKAPAIDADAVYRYVLACFPDKSNWNLNVDLKGQLSSAGTDLLGDSALNSTSLGNSYVAIVASLPLYSSSELDRAREREHNRRQDVAKVVADFITALAARNHAVRELALYRSLETRASIRVQQGIADATEQIGYLEKVANSQEKLVSEEAKIMENRLKLTGMCDPVNADNINRWLTQVGKVPK